MFWVSVAVVSICGIVSLVMWIKVLIKLFKQKGALHLILGILVNLYPFVWGWIKHKEQQLTKVMIGWTVAALVSAGASFVMTTAMVGVIQDAAQNQAAPDAVAQAKAARAKAAAARARAAAKAEKAKAQEAAPAAGDPFAGAVALWQEGAYRDPRAAVDRLDAFVEKNPKAAAGYNNRGVALLGLGETRRAIRDFNQALIIAERYPEAYNNRGNAYFALEEYDKALEDYAKAAELAPQKAFGHLNRGLALMRLERPEEACKALQEACRRGDCDGVRWAKGQDMCPDLPEPPPPPQ